MNHLLCQNNDYHKFYEIYGQKPTGYRLIITDDSYLIQLSENRMKIPQSEQTTKIPKPVKPLLDVRRLKNLKKNDKCKIKTFDFIQHLKENSEFCLAQIEIDKQGQHGYIGVDEVRRIVRHVYGTLEDNEDLTIELFFEVEFQNPQLLNQMVNEAQAKITLWLINYGSLNDQLMYYNIYKFIGQFVSQFGFEIKNNLDFTNETTLLKIVETILNCRICQSMQKGAEVFQCIHEYLRNQINDQEYEPFNYQNISDGDLLEVHQFIRYIFKAFAKQNLIDNDVFDKYTESDKFAIQEYLYGGDTYFNTVVMKKVKDDYEQQLSDYQNQIATLTEEIQELADVHLMKASNTIEELQSQKDELEKALECQFEQIIPIFKEMRSQKHEVEKQLEEILTQMYFVGQKNQDLNKEITETREEHPIIIEDHMKQQELIIIKEQHLQLQHEYDDFKQRTLNELDKNQQLIEEYESQLQALTMELTELKVENQAVFREKERLHSQVDQFQRGFNGDRLSQYSPEESDELYCRRETLYTQGIKSRMQTEHDVIHLPISRINTDHDNASGFEHQIYKFNNTMEKHKNNCNLINQHQTTPKNIQHFGTEVHFPTDHHIKNEEEYIKQPSDEARKLKIQNTTLQTEVAKRNQVIDELAEALSTFIPQEDKLIKRKMHIIEKRYKKLLAQKDELIQLLQCVMYSMNS